MSTLVPASRARSARWGVPVGLLLTIAALGIGTARLFRPPYAWALGQWLVSYKFGFIKRGLPGTLLLPFIRDGGANERFVYWLITAVATALHLALLAVLAALCWRVVRRGPTWTSLALVLMFATSAWVTMSMISTGNFDDPLTLLVLAAVPLLRRRRWLATSVILLAALLTHESVVFMGLPLLGFVAWLDRLGDGTDARTTRRRTALDWLRLAAIPVLGTLALFAYNAVMPDRAAQQRRWEDYMRPFPWLIDNTWRNLPQLMLEPFGQFLREQSPQFLHRITDPYGREIVIPVLIMLGYAWWRLRGRAHRWTTLGLMAAVAALPQALHVIAWDVNRIWSMSILACFLALWQLLEHLPESRREAPVVGWLAAGWAVVSMTRPTWPIWDRQHENLPRLLTYLLYAPEVAFLVVLCVALLLGLLRNRSRDDDDR